MGGFLKVTGMARTEIMPAVVIGKTALFLSADEKRLSLKPCVIE
jgi:hypothetical protein